MANKKKIKKTKKKIKRNVLSGVVHIKSTFNNTIVSISDREGNVIAWASAGNMGYKGSKKSTSFAAQVTAEAVAKKAIDQGMKEIDVLVKGPGSGRETAIRSLQAVGLKVNMIKDVTSIPHNGCRPPKQRRT